MPVDSGKQSAHLALMKPASVAWDCSERAVALSSGRVMMASVLPPVELSGSVSPPESAVLMVSAFFEAAPATRSHSSARSEAGLVLPMISALAGG